MIRRPPRSTRTDTLSPSPTLFRSHLERGRGAGGTPDDVTRLLAGPSDESWSGWPPRERALLDAVEALHHRQDLTDGEWGALQEHYDERAAIEVCFLAGHYEMLATVIQPVRTDTHRPRPGAEHPPPPAPRPPRPPPPP